MEGKLFRKFKLWERVRTRGIGLAIRLRYQADFLGRTGETFGTPESEFQDGDRSTSPKRTSGSLGRFGEVKPSELNEHCDQRS